MEVKGTIIKVMPIKKGISKVSGKEWSTRDFVVEIPNENNPQYPERLVLNIFGDEKANDKSLIEGNEVTVYFNFSAREYKDAYYNTLSVWKIESCDTNSNSISRDAYKKAQEFQLQERSQNASNNNIQIQQVSSKDEELPF